MVSRETIQNKRVIELTSKLRRAFNYNLPIRPGAGSMTANSSTPSVIRFDGFELDTANGELRRSDRTIPLRPQACRALIVLAGRAGELVTRDDLRGAIWGWEKFVDFEHGLNLCIRQVREALGDDAHAQRYIQTLPRRGYRFVAPVQMPGSPRRAVIAVLPFENLSGDPGQEYLSDAVTEEMITELGRLDPERLGVIARTSVMRYKNARRGLRGIARDMGIDYVLEGSVRSHASRIRVAVQLVRVADQTHLWAESYERRMTDLLDLQADVARIVAAQIDLKLSVTQQERLGRGRSLNLEAHEAYLRGRLHLRKMTREGTETAIKYFQQALTIEPQNAMVYAAMADAYIGMTSWHSAPLDTMPQAREAARKALALEPDLAVAHALMGTVHLLFDWDWKAAGHEFNRAIELDPNLADGHVGYAALLTALGQFETALRELKIAQSLDPMSPSVHGDELWMWFGARRYDEAVAESRRWLEVDANFGRAYWTMALALSYAGKHNAAIGAARKGVRVSDSPFAAVALAEVYARGGNTRQARTVLNTLESAPHDKYVCAYNMAAVYAALGETERAFESLQRGVLQRSD
ncbi:MAG TPA: winged helix-turn-helix domain-containing protein [Vicinamibacterales bacterium]|nr:winged helix-turn-helix domain-containing protein [Vicinamibacterales bacterium]